MSTYMNYEQFWFNKDEKLQGLQLIQMPFNNKKDEPNTIPL